MPHNRFEEEAEKRPKHNDFAAYMNQVKKNAVDTEYHGAVEHELTRATQITFNQLMATTAQDQVLLLVGVLKGLRLAATYIDSQWPVDKETDSEEPPLEE